MIITLTKDEAIKILLESLPVNPDLTGVTVQMSDYDYEHFFKVTIEGNK